ncbi:hypothetical protein RvVAR0630_pl09180 (plasmid) [Agrobacterium vitis]|nr:hypothetical protein RvVAR0630_pl09180 [Agrobacterium vitis]
MRSKMDAASSVAGCRLLNYVLGESMSEDALPQLSGRHFCAAVRTATASRYTRFHVPDALTIVGALSANLSAFSTDVLVML